MADVRAPPRKLGDVPATEGLQGRNPHERMCSELEYRQHRPVYNSSVAKPQIPSRRPLRRPAGARQHCRFNECKLMHDEEHLDRFTHECKRGEFCDLVRDERHRARYRHPTIDRLEWKEGWAAENERSSSCAPMLGASKLSQSMPALSCVPRGGFRPAGGTQSMTEMKDLRRRADDSVILVVHGIHLLWTDHEFFSFVRDWCPFAIVDATVVPSDSEFQNAGRGLVTCYNYADAEKCRQILHNRDLSVHRAGGSLLVVEYRDAIKNAVRDTYAGKRHQDIFGIKDADPAVPRYNQLLGRCGAYWQDAEGIIQRMRNEGHQPNIYTYVALLFCYRNGKPPQPQKALLTLDRMRSEGISITTTACNLVVDAWCRAGNMPRAEALVKQMEAGITMKSKWAVLEVEKPQLALPNNETYFILTDGWQRLGVMEDIAHRQRGYRMDHPPPVSIDSRREPAIAGVLGLSSPAPSILTSLARRRGGWCPNHLGFFQQQANEENFGLFEPNKWRSRV
jgi:pentatricopeptide repeat protein